MIIIILWFLSEILMGKCGPLVCSVTNLNHTATMKNVQKFQREAAKTQLRMLSFCKELSFEIQENI